MVKEQPHPQKGGPPVQGSTEGCSVLSSPWGALCSVPLGGVLCPLGQWTWHSLQGKAGIHAPSQDLPKPQGSRA